MTTLLLIRHAAIDTDARLCGCFDVASSATGRAQLEATVQRLPTRTAPDALYTSGLIRAREVARALGRVWRLEPRVADALREIHCGRAEGMRLADLEARYPELWTRDRAQTDDDFAWPEGESYGGFRARVLSGCRDIAAAHPGQRVAVVTHAGVISQIIGTLRGRAPARWEADRPDPLTATEVTWAGDAPRDVLVFNTPHWF